LINSIPIISTINLVADTMIDNPLSPYLPH
jgi:hypothetical protein